MTQPSTSNNSLPDAHLLMTQTQALEDNAESNDELVELVNSQQPAILHPNFDPKQIPLDPARSLSDIPEPARRVNSQLRRLYGSAARLHQAEPLRLSKWSLIASQPFAEHLSLLNAAKLIKLPDSFYHSPNHSPNQSHSPQPLLTDIEQMTLLDLADIQRAIQRYPTLTRFGFVAAKPKPKSKLKPESKAKLKTDSEPAEKVISFRALLKSHNPDELLNSIYADDWQVILQPQDFETGAGSLATDIMACSVAVHALKQCDTRQSINKSYSAEQICHYVRSYLLSQLNQAPANSPHYRQIRLFSGHIIVAAYHLGWDIQIADDHCYVNISSRCGLLARYPNMQDYAINGWSS